ncbi:copalyl diphosphate synthase 1, chloroplastic-like isoform X2 [Coffea arabica]|uniref:Copalyl diphosphate synthase 1, chloroplastic-like isoform X2 n=1 Tax=Coffea arabica TaxID=13443 RepID=A0ABM4VEN4_COFAR
MWTLASLQWTSSSSLARNPTLHAFSRFDSVGTHVMPGARAFNPKELLKNYHVICKPLRVAQIPVKQTHEDDGIRGNDHEDSISYIKRLLRTMDDGRITISAYDTAWIALIEDVNGSDNPQFPSSLQWIIDNQLPDGSWGEAHFCPYDRLLNTLACVIALKSWTTHEDKIAEGIAIIKTLLDMCKLENVESMICGFEVIFPALLERARNLGIEIPSDTPFVKEICAARDLKLERIPKDLMHALPTSLLYSLEGFSDLNWDKVLKLKCHNGSFLTSPASTAFAFIETKDEQCLNFITEVTQNFNGGAPPCYPVDLYARLFAVDRLKRLGISRYFMSEIDECLNHVYRCWTEDGIFSGRGTNFSDIDDTSMGFRLLRLHGYDMSPEVFKNFKKDDKFSCYPGQMIEAATPIFNFYRASQVLFPGEKILEEAREFAYNFLQNWLACGNYLDKWIIAKDIPSEVRYALEVPWYASLPRIETRFYVEQYGGTDDVWIAKTLYRMPEISNNAYLELAKGDYNKCQLQHLNQWTDIQQWYKKCNLVDHGISIQFLEHAFFVAMASIFEPERSKERIAWTKSFIFCEMIKFYFNATSFDKKKMFLMGFKSHTRGTMTGCCRSEVDQRLLSNLLEFLHQLSTDTAQELGKDIRQQLFEAWESWLMTNTEKFQWGEEAELLVRTINLCAGRITSDHTAAQLEHYRLSKLINKICHQLHESKSRKAIDAENSNGSFKRLEVEEDMQALVQLVLQNSAIGNPSDIKQTFLAVAKTFFYTTYCDKDTIDFHISKVLHEPIV